MKPNSGGCPNRSEKTTRRGRQGDVIIQPRSPTIITETDAVSPACKIGVVLDPIEAVRLMGILASAECVRGVSRATGKSE